MVGLVFLGGSYVACHSSTAEPEESAKDTLGPWEHRTHKPDAGISLRDGRSKTTGRGKRENKWEFTEINHKPNSNGNMKSERVKPNLHIYQASCGAYRVGSGQEVYITSRVGFLAGQMTANIMVQYKWSLHSVDSTFISCALWNNAEYAFTGTRPGCPDILRLLCISMHTSSTVSITSAAAGFCWLQSSLVQYYRLLQACMM